MAVSMVQTPVKPITLENFLKLPELLCQAADQLLPVPGFAEDFELTVGTLVSWLYD